MTAGLEIFERLETECRSYCRGIPVIFDKAQGSVITGADGSEYLDFFSGAGAVNYGHNHPQMTQAITEYLQSSHIVHALDLHTTTKSRLLTAIDEVLLKPNDWDYKIQFTGPTGTDANEAALKLARIATGRRRVVAFNGSYHGMSIGSLSVSGSNRLRSVGGPLLHETTFVPFEDGPVGKFDSIEFLERLSNDAGSGQEMPAAVIVEGVQIQAGVYSASNKWLQDVRAWTKANDVIMIMDEVQTGCGRTGAFFSFERAGIVPDMITVAKSIGGYGLPMALVFIAREFDKWNPGDHTGTFRGNQLAFLAGEIALHFWQDPEFLKLVKANCDAIETAMATFAREPIVHACRCEGLIAGIDFGAKQGNRAERFQKLVLDAGVIVETCGPDHEVVKLMPPINTPTTLLIDGLDRLTLALKALN